ncbi:TetR/AcrR family transcriptional regulator [Streptomyces zhihengii]|uniref:TetR/AcrR family transcriptional regulator n=1 Tax=Streptomyces zhihengii TaxID=1818004 RepID=UPI0036361FF3
MARPKQQDARREELLRAARAVILTRGLNSTRVRDIADQAGVATGTVTYYFRELDELFDLVFAEAVERFCTAREHDTLTRANPREQLAALLRSGLPSGPDDELCCLLYEFSPQARQRASDAASRRELYGRQVDLYIRVLTAGQEEGRFRLQRPAAEIAANLVALEDAYGYHVIAQTFMTRQTAEQHLFGYAALATADSSLAP